MARRRESELPKKARLLVSRADARDKIESQIQKGAELNSLNIGTDEELKDARRKYYSWDEYNCELLTRLFDATSYAEEYRGFSLGWADLPLHGAAEELHRHVDSKVRRLESVVSRLELVDEPTSVVSTTKAVGNQRKKIFLAHGGISPNRDKLELFLWRSGYRPLIVDELPSKGLSPDQKVAHYLEQSDFAVILAEANRSSTQDGKQMPRLNIIDEISRARAVLGGKLVLLLQEGLALPSNQNVTWWSFSTLNVDSALSKIFDELRSAGLHGVTDLD